MFRFFRTLALAALLLFPSLAQANEDPSITVTQAWARPAAQGENGAVYATLSNSADHDVVLTGIATAVSGMPMLHKTEIAGGIAQMREADGLRIPAHGAVALEPGALHIMLMDLNKPLKDGDSFPLTLAFGPTHATTHVNVRRTAPTPLLRTSAPDEAHNPHH